MDWYQTIKDFAGPLATVIASVAAAFVAYRLGQNQMMVARAQANIAERNWQTENEKVVLELMERRLAIYKSIREVIAEVMQTGKKTTFISATCRRSIKFPICLVQMLKAISKRCASI
jgi:2C-methyl-D-erythritol 2,4-cyclodiphosphate synthase